MTKVLFDQADRPQVDAAAVPVLPSDLPSRHTDSVLWRPGQNILRLDQLAHPCPFADRSAGGLQAICRQSGHSLRRRAMTGDGKN
ncbi:hypothetical protein [Jannaschia faecimaris]|uniref:hypothetical protein n=1 Tax=Jannaschia faecimaris TaxID=1244108 RepID=UPI001114108C|nr:hypothetical protein [Jannaschia faecimaris]